MFWFDAGSSFNGGLPAFQSGTFDIAQVKLEDGLVATDGWHPYDGEFGGEVQACKRYYEVCDMSVKNDANLGSSNVSFGYCYPYAVHKRVTPTMATIAEASNNCTAAGFEGGRVQSASLRFAWLTDGVVSRDKGIVFTASAEL
jgi:hypothetical protein